MRAKVTGTAGDWNRCHDGDGDVVLIVSATDLFHARQLLRCLPPPPRTVFIHSSIRPLY